MSSATNFATNAQYVQWLNETFGPYRNHEDPLMAYLTVAIEKDLNPVDAMHYWIITNGKNAFYFKAGMRRQKQLLNLLTGSKDYFNKYAKDFVEYMAWLAKTV